MALRWLTKKYLKEKIGCENIFEKYFGAFEFGKSTHSPLRQDDKKSVRIYITKNNNIVYQDFALNIRMDCIAFVKQMFQLNESDTLLKIAEDFGILNGEGTKYLFRKKIDYEKEKQPIKFDVKTRPFTPLDLDWWQQYSITKEELKENNIYSVSTLTISSKDKSTIINTKQDEIKFCYLFNWQGNKYVKIYTPNKKEFKWFTNAPLSLVVGLEKLSLDKDTLIITKSLKDYITLKKFYSEVIALQNESIAALPEYIIKILQKQYKRIFIWFDDDKPGIRAANIFKKLYKFIPIQLNLGKSIWQIIKKSKEHSVKDPSDFVKKWGIKKFKEYLIYKINNYGL